MQGFIEVECALGCGQVLINLSNVFSISTIVDDDGVDVVVFCMPLVGIKRKHQVKHLWVYTRDSYCSVLLKIKQASLYVGGFKCASSDCSNSKCASFDCSNPQGKISLSNICPECHLEFDCIVKASNGVIKNPFCTDGSLMIRKCPFCGFLLKE